MNSTVAIHSATIIVSLVLILLIARVLVTMKGFRRPYMESVGVIDRLKEIGELVALSAFYKDITVAKDEDGKLTAGKKMALISEFDLEYRYDLRSAVIADQQGVLHIRMPECTTKVNTGNIMIYDEQKGRLLGLPVSGFSTGDRNRLVKQARDNAVDIAKKKTEDLLGKIERSAEHTLKAFLAGCGVKDVSIEFTRSSATLTNMARQIGEIRELKEVG